MELWIIELIGENGTHFTVKKAFRTRDKAMEYAKTIAYISGGIDNTCEAVKTYGAVKVMVVD